MNLVSATTDVGRSPTRGQRVLQAAAVTLLCLLAVLDLLDQATGGHGLWWTVAVLAIGLTSVLWPARRRPPWLNPAVRAAVPAFASLAVTLAAVLAGRQVLPGPGEVALLLCLLVVALRGCSVGWAAACTVLTGAAIGALALRGSAAAPDPGVWSGIALVLAILIAGAAVLGGYLRTLDERRRVAVTRTRQAERLSMAADLHDFVAHHVTGILVQAQVARMMAAGRPGGPDGLDPVLEGIEQAATQALASMRRTVGILRAENPGAGTGGIDGTGGIGGSAAATTAAATGPGGDLAALPQLVEDFGGPAGPVTELRRAASVPGDLPHEVQAAAYRVVREALTNIRRHAADADAVTVELSCDGRMLQIIVSDDGRGAFSLPADARGGGFGLVGLAERVTALGGELRAGPRPQHGWTLAARLPAGRTSAGDQPSGRPDPAAGG